jgi:serine/threonine-protein kinase
MAKVTPEQPVEQDEDPRGSFVRVQAKSDADGGGSLPVSVRWHLLMFTLLNGLLAAINLAFSPSVLWFMWVTGVWGIGLVVHAFAAFELRSSRANRTRGAERSRGDGDGSRRRRRASREQVPGAASELGLSPTLPSDRQPPAAAHAPVSGDAPTLARAHLPERQGSLQPRQRVAGRFVIERALGAGGMGEVYLARDETLGEVVALKTIATTLVTPSALERFRREAQAARRITHPNVVRIHDIGQDGDLAFISMEYIEGVTLGRRIELDAPLPLAEIQRIGLELCAGLQAAHAAGVVHRDLKPYNVLLDRAGHARIIDFGLARLEAAGSLTATGAVMGTPEYMAPEQVLGKAVDVRTDVYALGCVLYHAIAGQPPFIRDSAVALGVAHCTEAPPPLSGLRADVTAGWEALVMRALEKDPGRRFESADALCDALRGL